MPLTREILRPIGSKAFKELKKYKFYEVKTEGSLSTLNLFGDFYQFCVDTERNIAWFQSKLNYKNSLSFKLFTSHKDWSGIFSFPGQFVRKMISDYLEAEKINVRGNEDAKLLGVECRIVATQVYHADKNKLASIFGNLLWKHLDKDAIKLTIKCFGFGSSSMDYNLVINNREEVIDTLEKAPSILPIWRDLAAYNIISSSKSNDFEVWQHFDTISSALTWLSPKFDPRTAKSFVFADIIKSVKTKLDGMGLTSAGWRFLLKMTPRMVQAVKRSVGMFNKGFVNHLNWFAKIGVMPRETLLKPLLNNAIVGFPEDFTYVIRSAFIKASKMRTGIKSFFQSQIQPVIDWFRNAGDRHETSSNIFGKVPARYVSCVKLDSNQRKAGWDWFIRQQREWHETLNLRERQKLKDKTKHEFWDSLLEEIIIDNYKIVSIVDSYSLIDEGKDMHHCVATYADRCLKGLSRIFSVRDLNDNKLATLELTNSNDKEWVVNQCRGLSNQNVSKELELICKKVAEKYSVAAKKTDRKGMRLAATC